MDAAIVLQRTGENKMENIHAQAIKAIESYKSNPTIMEFVNKEAAEQTAADIRATTGSGTTAKAVELLMLRNEKVKERFVSYVNAGLIGVYMASFPKA